MGTLARGGPRPQATCCPDQPHHAKGLCKTCYDTSDDRNNKRIAWREANSDYHLKLRYGVTHVDYQRMLQEQGGVCAICGNPPGNRKLAVDHCHETLKVRGLLCHTCNTALERLIGIGVGRFTDYLAR